MNLCNGIEDCCFFERCKALGKLAYVRGDNDGEHYVPAPRNFDEFSLLNLCPRKDFLDDGISFIDLLIMHRWVMVSYPDKVPTLDQLVEEATALGVYNEFPILDEVKYKRMSLDAIKKEVNVQNGQT